MPRTWQAEDAVEPVSDTMMEAFGNWNNYNVVSGCEATYSATDLTVAVSAGQIKANGALVVVPAGTTTLVPDNTYPLWAWIHASALGATVFHGTPAADPAIPELTSFGDLLACQPGLVLVQPNQTIAANCAYKFDKRLFGPRVVVVSSGDGGASAILNADTAAPYGAFTTLEDLSISVAASTRYSFRIMTHYTMPTTGAYKWRLTAPTGSVMSTLSQQFDLSAVGGVTYVSGYTFTGQAYGFGSATPGVVAFEGSLTTGTNAGELVFAAGGTITGGFTKAKSRIELF